MGTRILGLVAAALFLTAGMFAQGNNCLHFDGIDDFVNVGDVDALDGTSTLTIEMWVNIETWGTWNTFFSKNDGDRIQFQLWPTEGDLAVIVESPMSGHSGGYGYTQTQPVYTGEWFHLAMVYNGNGATDADRLKLYINGAQQTLAFLMPDVPTTTPNTDAPVLLGAETVANPFGFNGQMDEVRVWSTARTESEVQQFMNTTLTGNEAGLLMYFDFNEGVAGGANGGVTVLTDATLNAYDGTLTNFDLSGGTSNWIARALTTPVSQSSDIVPVNTYSTSVDLAWTTGSGSNRAVFMKETVLPESPAPVDNTTYTAGAAFGSGSQIGTSGWFCVYDGNGNTVTVTGIVPSTQYRIMVCEYNTDGSTVAYNSTPATDNPQVFATPLPIQLAGFTASAIGGSQVRVQWATVTETNNYGFEVQRAAGTSLEFVTIPNAFVQGHGTSTEPHDYVYVDESPAAGTCSYRLRQIDLDGTVHFTEPVAVSIPTGVGETVPLVFALGQNFPNPFNPTTVIAFQIANPGFVSLKVYDLLGAEVATLVEETLQAGRYQKSFDASALSSGVYVYRLQTGAFSATKKLLLVR